MKKLNVRIHAQLLIDMSDRCPVAFLSRPEKSREQVRRSRPCLSSVLLNLMLWELKFT